MAKSKNFHELAQYSGTDRKRLGYTGHATLRNIRPSRFQPHRRAVRFVLSQACRRKDFHTLLMFTELESVLRSLPIVRQGSTRGHSAPKRAAYILAHIYRQRANKPWCGKPRPARLQPAFEILVRALSVECFDRWPVESTTTYKRKQLCLQVHRLLWSDKLMLYGRLKRQRISMQGRAVAEHLYGMIEPIYRLWLRDHKAEIHSQQRWITGFGCRTEK